MNARMRRPVAVITAAAMGLLAWTAATAAFTAHRRQSAWQRAPLIVELREYMKWMEARPSTDEMLAVKRAFTEAATDVLGGPECALDIGSGMWCGGEYHQFDLTLETSGPFIFHINAEFTEGQWKWSVRNELYEAGEDDEMPDEVTYSDVLKLLAYLRSTR